MGTVVLEMQFQRARVFDRSLHGILKIWSVLSHSVICKVVAS